MSIYRIAKRSGDYPDIWPELLEEGPIDAPEYLFRVIAKSRRTTYYERVLSGG